ncbi:MAG TPA: hypothetical protein PK677_15710 [Acidiphilium sp.]|nr:MAG: hypothetical protein B7X48_14315 [Acidiphilium sp. 34-60-192]HQT89961.1 hypothetical protein [Acidiphilium sp.]
MSDDTFGFGKAGAGPLSKRLAQIKPSGDNERAATDLQAIDEAGQRAGFTSREPGPAPFRRVKTIGPTIQLNTRAPEDVAIRFIQFCEQNRLAYWEGILELMKRANV